MYTNSINGFSSLKRIASSPIIRSMMKDQLFRAALVALLTAFLFGHRGSIAADLDSSCKVLDQDIALEYQGACNDGLANGPGAARGKDFYKGFFLAGWQDGVGEYVWASGQRYVGEFKRGRVEGRGTMFLPTGMRIEATFSKGNAVGEGILVDAKGDRYKFDFDNKRVISKETSRASPEQSAVTSADSPISVVYVPPSNPELSTIYYFAKRNGILEAASRNVMRNLKLVNPPKVQANACGKINAYYQPSSKTISVCYELLDLVFRSLPDDFKNGRETYNWFDGLRPSDEQIARFSSGLLDYVFFHEFGHALVDLLKLPVLGKEEDAADQVSLFLLLKQQSSVDNLRGAVWFNKGARIFFSRNDTHSWGPQRQVNVACWAFGGNAKEFAPLLKIAKVSNERAKQCRYEYLKIQSSVQALLGANLR